MTAPIPPARCATLLGARLVRLNQSPLSSPSWPETRFDTERELQSICEAHLPQLLGAEVLASEYQAGPGRRIDTLAIDRQGYPVVIEYKRCTSETVINQAVDYQSWVQRHPREFEALARAHGYEVNWDVVRVICVAHRYSRQDAALMEWVPFVERYEYALFGDNLVLSPIGLDAPWRPPAPTRTELAVLSGQPALRAPSLPPEVSRRRKGLITAPQRPHTRLKPAHWKGRPALRDGEALDEHRARILSLFEGRRLDPGPERVMRPGPETRGYWYDAHRDGLDRLLGGPAPQHEHFLEIHAALSKLGLDCRLRKMHLEYHRDQPWASVQGLLSGGLRVRLDTEPGDWVDRQALVRDLGRRTGGSGYGYGRLMLTVDSAASLQAACRVIETAWARRQRGAHAGRPLERPVA